jgi:hypothetical protein
MIGVPYDIPTRKAIIRSTGDNMTMPGIVRARSKIRFEIGIGLYFSVKSIK